MSDTPETPTERAERVERLYDKCERRGGGSMADVETFRNDVRAFASHLNQARHTIDNQAQRIQSFSDALKDAEAERDKLRAQLADAKATATALEHATKCWHETNAAIGEASGHGNPPDPYRYAALLDGRAAWWDRLGQLADQAAGIGLDRIRDVYAIACSYAAELDRNDAAGVRFRYRIPSLHPATDAARIKLDSGCRECGRPLQLDRYAAPNRCPACPDLLYGITPHSAEQAKTYPPGEQWVPAPDRAEGDGE